MPANSLSRDELAEAYLAQLPYEPYPVQEDALLAWFTTPQGVLVCAPTGTGKTVIAEAALFEALHTGKKAYYTTPLIALTEQKFAEMQSHAVRWGFMPEDVGLVTGNRRVNPDAKVLVVVAEILLNRLLSPEASEFDDVASVVMDEFHSFNDPERGIVWEFTLSLLPPHVRLLLLSATVGNSREFVMWLKRCHKRTVELIEGDQRRVPLVFQWVPDQLLNEQVELMAAGDEESRLTPTLLFCFNRSECWNVAEQLKGKSLIGDERKKKLAAELAKHDFSTGAGAKLKQLLMRGVGIHHAGIMPRYRRIVEELYTRKLLAVGVCTETLAAGINLPARSVVMTSLVKGPPGKMRLIEPSSAHQIFGRAGRPQFDDRGYVVSIAHEDDVRIARWKEKYDAIPEDTKDPGLMKAKKALKKKRPTRRDQITYWNESQFEKLKAAPAADLASRGEIPWRLLAYLLRISPDISLIRDVVHKRLLPPGELEQEEKRLTRRLLTLHRAGYVELEPTPPAPKQNTVDKDAAAEPPDDAGTKETLGTLGALLSAEINKQKKDKDKPAKHADQVEEKPKQPHYVPRLATPTGKLDRLLIFRGIHPLYADFLMQHLGIADREERIQAMESVLELPRSLGRSVWVPLQHDLPPGPLAQDRLDVELVQRGLMAPPAESDDDDDDEYAPRPPHLAEKLRMLFDAENPHVYDLRTSPVWVAGELLRFNGDFDQYVRSADLTKQEGVIFRHILRFILLLGEFAQLQPDDDTPGWSEELRGIADQLTASCRAVDPESTDKMIENMATPDVIAAELAANRA
ncbi:MAG: DEAD/DEAH box helicase [Pirellulales bacterium]|nr:DEAD/DEAH box helicase [Pirellulales bacterium]